MSATPTFSASLMCAQLGHLASEVGRLERAGVDSLHIDVMDGHFVRNLTFGPDVVAAVRPMSGLPIDVHAMVDDPSSLIDPIAHAGAHRFIFHIESCRYPLQLIAGINALGMTAGVALNPATPVAAIECIVPIPLVLVMTVEPGFAGQDWIATSPAKVRLVRELCGPGTSIVVDGHIDPTTAPSLASAGADTFVCGTASIFGGGHHTADYATALALLRDSLPSAQRGKASAAFIRSSP